jgi:hypothetical protein
VMYQRQRRHRYLYTSLLPSSQYVSLTRPQHNPRMPIHKAATITRNTLPTKSTRVTVAVCVSKNHSPHPSKPNQASKSFRRRKQNQTPQETDTASHNHRCKAEQYLRILLIGSDVRLQNTSSQAVELLQ